MGAVIPVHVVIPTYRRPKKLARCVRSIEEQTYESLTWRAVEDTAREFAIGIWNRVAPEVTEGAFVYLCDDTELHPGCIENAVEALAERWPDTDGVVGLCQKDPSGRTIGTQAGMGMIGARFLDRFPGRRPFCPEYTRFSFDAELGDVARALDRFHFCRDATLVHYHPRQSEGGEDETHRLVRDPVEVEEDQRIRRLRKKRGLLWGITDELVGRR